MKPATVAALRREATLPAIIADQAGAVTFVNAAFTRVFGWTAREIVGRPLSVIIPPRLREAHHLGFARFLATGKGTLFEKPLELPAVTRGGTELACEHFIITERGARGWVFAATIRPLAAR